MNRLGQKILLIMGVVPSPLLAAGFGLSREPNSNADTQMFWQSDGFTYFLIALSVALLIALILVARKKPSTENPNHKEMQSVAAHWKKSAHSILENMLVSVDAKAMQEMNATRFLDTCFTAVADHHDKAAAHQISTLQNRLQEVEGSLQSAESLLASTKSELDIAKAESTEYSEKWREARSDIDDKLWTAGHKAIEHLDANSLTEELNSRLEGLRKEAHPDDDPDVYIKWIIETAKRHHPDSLDRFRDLAYVSKEQERIVQYHTIIGLYNEKIAKIRKQEMDEEDQEEAIIAMKRLRDREIDLLEQA